MRIEVVAERLIGLIFTGVLAWGVDWVLKYFHWQLTPFLILWIIFYFDLTTYLSAQDHEKEEGK